MSFLDFLPQVSPFDDCITPDHHTGRLQESLFRCIDSMECYYLLRLNQ